MATAIGALLLAGFTSAGEIEWRSDLDAACAEAKQAGRPLFVVFRCER